MSLQAGGTRGLKVACLVADQNAVRCIHGEPSEQICDHSVPGLASIAQAAISLNGSLRVIRTIFECDDMRSDHGHLVGHPAMQGMHVPSLVESTGKARSIGLTRSPISGVVDRLHGIP